MFQIETIIINTSLIQITEKSIPENFRATNSSTPSCNETFTSDQKAKKDFNSTAVPTDFQQPLHKAARFPAYFNALDLLKSDPKK